MKIICVGMNYKNHLPELSSKLDFSAEPVIFLKPDSAILKDSRPFFIPEVSNQIEYEAELVVLITRLGKHISERFAHRYYDKVTIGVSLAARDLQEQACEKRLPWTLSEGFDGSAVLGQWVKREDLKSPDNISFHLDVNNETVQIGLQSDMTHSVDKVIAYVSKFMTLKMGDIIFTGTTAGVDKLQINQHIDGYLEDKKLLSFDIR
ncbi:MAG: fumarylacetoacetate hydrolase family protein [Bacteroidaceae bacterium]